ncbi:hypothetical protein [Microvirga sp. M2]|uniref:hypothetical protein n=1 Tax=Microvirga sp. M2 TaxID=3073270 RepID=UPI0039C3715F
MAELVVIGFDTPHEADRVPTQPRRLEQDDVTDLEGAVAAILPPDGKARLKKSIDPLGTGAAMILRDAHDATKRTAGQGDDGTNDLIVSEMIRINELET